MAKQQLQKEDALLEAMVKDALQLSERRNRPCFVGFLDEREQTLIRNLMEQTRTENYMLWGGYPNAERVVFGAFSAYAEPTEFEFPIQPITIQYRKQDVLSHRDFLGALMALGITRESVGDILVEAGRCVLLLREEIVPYVTAQVTKIGSVGVSVIQGAETPYPQARRYQEFSVVVSSLRADCIVAACADLSREKTKLLFPAGLITVNCLPCQSPAQVLAPGDKLSIRGKGKFCLSQIGGLTKKGRIAINVKKYI